MAERPVGSLIDCPVKFPLEASPALAQSLCLPAPQRKLAVVILSGCEVRSSERGGLLHGARGLERGDRRSRSQDSMWHPVLYNSA